jgi:hypothetical protein
MNPIDYPADFETTVGAALAHPCCVDSRGNLYALRDDGATVLVAGPETGTNVQFQDAGSGQQVAWAVAQERLFVRFNEGEQTIQAALPRTCDSIGLPAYRRSALTVASSSSAYLVHNTEEALYCFTITSDGIRMCAKVEGHKGFGAWVEGGDLYVFGMRTRIHKIVKPWFSKAQGFSLKYGIGTLVRIDLSSGDVHIDAAADTKKALVAAWKVVAGESEDRYVKPLLEVWLDSVETEQGRVLIGGVMDARLPEFDDTSEEPHPADFVGIALYRWREGKEVELLRLLRDVRYIGRMARPDGEMLYFVKQEDPRDVFADRPFALRVTSDMQSPLLPLAFDWAQENLWTVQFEPCHDARVGAAAAVTTKIRNTPLPYRRHLAMSDDGLAWRFVHALPEQRV